ncbi:MAG: hypothetical protein ABH862_01855 [Candidatus Omnitrophota bacterium]
MKKYLIGVMFLCFFGMLLTACFSSVFADNPWDVDEDMRSTNDEEESDERAAQREMDSSVSGKVLRVNGTENALTIMADGSSVTYFIEPGTTFTLVSSLDGISPGDTVTIDYYTFKGKRFAEGIDLEKKGQAEETKVKPYVAKVLVD